MKRRREESQENPSGGTTWGEVSLAAKKSSLWNSRSPCREAESMSFTAIDEVPPSLAGHFRYPELLYDLQSRAYATVHVDDARTFYDGGDRWAIPQGLGRTSPAPTGPATDAAMPAYYMTLALPGEATADFTLVRPFVPGGTRSAALTPIAYQNLHAH